MIKLWAEEFIRKNTELLKMMKEIYEHHIDLNTKIKMLEKENKELKKQLSVLTRKNGQEKAHINS